MKTSQERIGMVFVIIVILAAAIGPVVTKLAVGVFSPLFAASMASLLGCIISLVVLIKNRKLGVIFDMGNLPSLFVVGLFGAVAYLLFFYGVSLTSGVNAAILLQAEPVYALLLGYFLLREKITAKQILFTLMILAGVASVIYNGAAALNFGDFLILATTLFYQVSHVIARKRMDKIGIFAVHAGRYLFGGLVLLMLSTVFGQNQFSLLANPFNLLSALVLGVVVAWLSTIAFYAAIQRINLSKVTAMIMPYPVLSIVLAWLVLKEAPSLYQIAGLIIMLTGVFFLARIKSEKRPSGKN